MSQVIKVIKEPGSDGHRKLVLDNGEELLLRRVSSQPYMDSVIEAGIIDDHPYEQIYLQLKRDSEEEAETILMRVDEVLAAIHVLSGALWSLSIIEKGG